MTGGALFDLPTTPIEPYPCTGSAHEHRWLRFGKSGEKDVAVVHVEAWRPDDDQRVTLSAGPVRVDATVSDPTFKPRPVGFAPPARPPAPDLPPVSCYLLNEPFEPTPLLWDGDQA